MPRGVGDDAGSVVPTKSIKKTQQQVKFQCPVT